MSPRHDSQILNGQMFWHHKVRFAARRGLTVSSADRAQHSENLRKSLRLDVFEARRQDPRMPLGAKQVVYVGQSHWCRLTKGADPDKLSRLKTYGFRGENGNLYKLLRASRV